MGFFVQPFLEFSARGAPPSAHLLEVPCRRPTMPSTCGVRGLSISCPRRGLLATAAAAAGCRWTASRRVPRCPPLPLEGACSFCAAVGIAWLEPRGPHVTEPAAKIFHCAERQGEFFTSALDGFVLGTQFKNSFPKDEGGCLSHSVCLINLSICQRTKVTTSWPFFRVTTFCRTSTL